MRHPDQTVQRKGQFVPDVAFPPGRCAHDLFALVPASSTASGRHCWKPGKAIVGDRMFAMAMTSGVWSILGCVAEIARLAQGPLPPF